MMRVSATTSDPLRRLSAVIVLYNSADVIEACLASIPRSVEVIAVDNASSDDGVARVRSARAGWDAKLPREHRVHDTGGAVESLEGACFVVSKADLEAIGGFDEDFFLYFEEESIALRLARLGGGPLYEPRAVAEHAGAS